MRFVNELEGLSGKIALLRIDLNIDPRDKNNLRFYSFLPTLRLLLSKGARVVLLSHYGRPRGENKEYSLSQHVSLVSRLCGESILFVDTLEFDEIRDVIAYGDSQIVCLENLRFSPGEEGNDAAFAEELASLGDLYVNDAFSVSHREHASVTGITRFIASFAGLQLSAEIDCLSQVLKNTERPFTLILGGAKVVDKLGVLKVLEPRLDYVLLGGGVANTFLALRGVEVFDSLTDMSCRSELVPYINSEKFFVPSDLIWSERRIVDIGESARAQFKEIINKSKVVVWSGPLGLIEQAEFRAGSLDVLGSMMSSTAFTVVGGGETVSLVSHDAISRLSHVSLAGTAMLDYLSTGRLPGIDALELSTMSF